MSLLFYSEEEENLKEESIDKYKNIFEEYRNKNITLSEALEQLFTSSNVEQNKINNFITKILKECEDKINTNADKIKEKYPSITKEDALIISSYTCEAEDSDFSPYKILNKNLVSDDRKSGLKKISKYLYIFLKSLRKLERYILTKENKYLYRCIGVKVNYMIDPFNDKSVPYIEGNKKTFYGFTSTSPNIKTSYKFLKEEVNIKTGTIFTLYGDVWGYDISLFNVYNEKEILLEPERKFIIDQVLPPINELIYVRCNMQKSNLVLNFENKKKGLIKMEFINIIETYDPEIKKYIKELSINENLLDERGNKNKNWNQNKRIIGGEEYISPSNEWIGIGLKVNNKYDNGNSTWLGQNNQNGEYSVAYYGINNNENLTKIIEDLTFENKTIFNEEKDIRNTGVFGSIFSSNKCGNGVILFQNPKFAENYASIIKISNNEQIKVLIMCRVNPKKIRQPQTFKNFWILNSIKEEIRPYRILIKNVLKTDCIDGNEYIKIARAPDDCILSAIKSKDFSFKNLSKEKRYKVDTQIRKDYFGLYLSMGEFYLYLNKFLIKKDINSNYFSESQLKSWTCCLYDEIKRIKNIKENTIVYRATKIKFSPDIGIGSRFYFPEFLITSLDERIVQSFLMSKNGTIMKIILKNIGVGGVPNYCCSTENISRYIYEKEVILTCYCSFIVINFFRKDGIDYVSLICEGFLFDLN